MNKGIVKWFNAEKGFKSLANGRMSNCFRYAQIVE